MQKTDKHITELLYEHNCVIVPEFGGFLANYSSAKIHPVQHLFSPPSKHIVFNSNLKNNDGLLANQIATAENINYSAAVEQIIGFVQEINTALKKGEKVKIDIVGTLYLDVERNIQFKPDNTNFLVDAFGLTEYQSPAIKQDTVAKRVEKELKKEGSKIIPINAPKRKINIKRAVAVAASFTLVAGILWVSLKSDVLKNVNYASLNPFALKTVPNNKIAIHSTPKKVVVTRDKATVSDTLVAPSAKEPVTASLVNAEPVKADSTLVVQDKTPVKTKYHLVTGCFQIKENALRFINSLQKQNIQSALIGKNDKGLYVVSCGDFNSQTEAAKGLKKLRTVQPNSWLYQSN